MRRQRKTRERKRERKNLVPSLDFPNLAFGQILRIGQHVVGTRPKRRTHPTRASAFTLSFPRYFIFSAWFASSPTQFLILSRSLRARRGKRKGKKKKDTGKNEKRERKGRRGKKIKRGCKRKANRKIRDESNYSQSFRLLLDKLQLDWPIAETCRWNRPDFEWFLPRFDEGWNASSRAIFSTVLPSSLAFSLPFSRDSFSPTAVSLRATFSNLARPNFLEILAFGVFRSRASWPKGNRATMKNFNNPAPGLSFPLLLRTRSG